MTVLVTGGAGYIGSHVVRVLRERGDAVVVVDDLSGGSLNRLGRVANEMIDLAMAESVDKIREVIRAHRIDSVIHLAAKKQVGESMARPAWYAQQNIGGLANLLIAMNAEAVTRLVYSSSAAVYGATEGAAIEESAPTTPINPYGFTKLVGEQLIAQSTEPSGLRGASLRYFNVAGSGWDELGDTSVSNLIPMVFARVDAGMPPTIFGDDYGTPDGTCIRDYVHVLDLVAAHLAALDATALGDPGVVTYNVGTGIGTSVRDIVDLIGFVVGGALPAVVEQRRPGDADIVVANPSKIQRELGWTATRSLDEIVASSWSAHLAQRAPGRMGSSQRPS